MPEIHLAIVGAGAKAAAIAARAKTLADLNIGRKISVTIYEDRSIGANWSGVNGYTDGVQTLCTPIERDLGYPYQSFPEEISKEIFKNFSWQSFLLHSDRNSNGTGKLSEWVDGGRKPPSHVLFSSYLKWAIEESKAKVVSSKVVGLVPHHSSWKVRSKGANATKASVSKQVFDGVVVTGPGPAKRVQYKGSSPRVYDGQTMWNELPRVRKSISRLPQDAAIAIIGAGGTAAAILAWLVRAGQYERQIFIIADQPAFFTRGDSVFENRLFNDEASWARLSPEAKEAFVNRLNRGVVWDTVMEQVAQAKNVVFHYGRARSIRNVRNGLEVNVKSGTGDHVDIEVGLVFDAAGFDAWWWLDLIEDEYFRTFPRRTIEEDLRGLIDPQLAFNGAGWKWPPLHAPMLATSIGPGFASLMSLGNLADRVLSRYLTA